MKTKQNCFFYVKNIVVLLLCIRRMCEIKITLRIYYFYSGYKANKSVEREDGS